MEVKASYKLTEVGVIPEEWDTQTVLGFSQQIIDCRGRTPRKLGMEWGQGDIPALSAGNVKMGFIDFSEECYFGSEALYKRWMTRGEVKKNDIAFTTEAPLGNVALIPDDRKYILSQRTVLLKIDRAQASSRFLFQFLLSLQFQRVLADYSSGSTAKGIQRKKLEQLRLPKPPLPEQRAIANALSDVDRLLKGLDWLIAKKRDLKQAAMQQLLTGQSRIPGFHVDWDVKGLDQFAPLQRGFDLPTSQIQEGDYPVVYSNGVQNYHARWMVRGPGVVTGRSGTIGNVHFLEEDFWPHNTALWVTNFKRNDPKFVFYYLASLGLEKFGTGSGVPTLNRNDVHEFSVRVPSLPSEQIAIANVLTDMDTELAALEQRREKTRALKQAMMQELLTGKTRLVTPATESTLMPTCGLSLLPTKIGKSAHSWAFNEAVVISVLASEFGKPAFPLGRMRYTKFAYFLHRHVEHKAEGYLKKAAGPYNPATRYAGPEKIAKQSGYIQFHKNEQFTGFVAGEKIEQARNYFIDWYGQASLDWLQQLRFWKKEQLEQIATVDMAMEELRRDDQAVTVVAVKKVVATAPEWLPKLDRSAFSDKNIAAAIERCLLLFPPLSNVPPNAGVKPSNE